MNDQFSLSDLIDIKQAIIGFYTMLQGRESDPYHIKFIAKKQNEISIGNIIGSNIFNILAILGITSSILPIRVESPEVLSFDLWYMLGISLLLMILILPLKGSMLRRWKGMMLVLAYILFIYFVYL